MKFRSFSKYLIEVSIVFYNSRTIIHLNKRRSMKKNVSQLLKVVEYNENGLRNHLIIIGILIAYN